MTFITDNQGPCLVSHSLEPFFSKRICTETKNTRFCVGWFLLCSLFDIAMASVQDEKSVLATVPGPSVGGVGLESKKRSQVSVLDTRRGQCGLTDGRTNGTLTSSTETLRPKLASKSHTSPQKQAKRASGTARKKRPALTK